MWLLFAILSPALWAVVHVLDSHCVHKCFDRPWVGVTTSALASLAIVPAVPLLAPLTAWTTPSWGIAAWAFLAGVLIQASQALYFQSLARSEAGIVAAYGNLVPAMLPAVAFVLLGRVFGFLQYMGIAVIVAASIAMCLLDGQLRTRWQSFLLMLGAAALHVAALLSLDRIYDELPYFEVFLLTVSGIVACGCAPLVFRRARDVFRRNTRRLLSCWRLLVGIEVINLCALAASHKAVQLGYPSLVEAVESTIPAFCFGLSVILCRLAPRFGDTESFQRIGWKLACVACMMLGVTLL